jgi:methylglutaconyl-CoA hydratase
VVNDEDKVRTITLNRPHRRNAMTMEMQDELIATLDDASESKDCRVVILTGASDDFCAGLDLTELQESSSKGLEDYRVDAERTANLFRALYELKKPTIAKVQGAAVAGGAGLATICDFTIASRSAKFGYPEVKVGFVPALVSAFLVLQIGQKKARNLLLTGRIVGADEALQLGIISEVVEAGNLHATVNALAMKLVEASPEALRATKALLEKQQRIWLNAALLQSAAANAAARQTRDCLEGVRAFLERRRPLWGE